MVQMEGSSVPQGNLEAKMDVALDLAQEKLLSGGPKFCGIYLFQIYLSPYKEWGLHLDYTHSLV